MAWYYALGTLFAALTLLLVWLSAARADKPNESWIEPAFIACFSLATSVFFFNLH